MVTQERQTEQVHDTEVKRLDSIAFPGVHLWWTVFEAWKSADGRRFRLELAPRGEAPGWLPATWTAEFSLDILPEELTVERLVQEQK
jgi:hypothetical protein